MERSELKEEGFLKEKWSLATGIVAKELIFSGLFLV